MEKVCKKSIAWLNSSSGVFSIVLMFLFSILLFMPQATALPHPIYGTATWEGGGYAVGANVEVVSSQGVLQTTVDEHGYWQIDVGDPGANWPSGTAFTVYINGTGFHTGWYGSDSDIVNGYFNGMGDIVVATEDSSSNQSNNEHPGGNNSGGEEPTGENLPPVADASAGEPYQGFIDEEILFDGSGSTDDGRITNYTWDFGDGTNGTGEIVTHTYSSVGTYTVVLTVIDDEGATGSYETIATISQPNIPPTTPEKISGPTEGSKNIEYNYTFLSTDDDNDSIKYSVDWEDGTTDESDFLPNGTAFEIAHSWTLPGKYIVTITADDNETITSTEMIVMIDAIDAGDIGYLTDDDGDGTYDIFHDSGLETNLGQENGKYLIDSDGDGEWDYIFDLTEGLVSYQEEGQVKTPGFELIIGIISIALILFFKRKKTESY